MYIKMVGGEACIYIYITYTGDICTRYCAHARERNDRKDAREKRGCLKKDFGRIISTA